MDKLRKFPWLNGYLGPDGGRQLACPACGRETVDWRGVCAVCGWRGRPVWMRSLRRHHRRRVIARRFEIRKNSWRLRREEDPLVDKPGKLAKWNLSCNCWLCKWEKKAGKEKPKYAILKQLFLEAQ